MRQHPEASTHDARPVFRDRFRTGKTRGRRSSAGLWYLYFDLTDQDGDEEPDTLRIVALRHSAARPFGIGSDSGEDEEA